MFQIVEELVRRGANYHQGRTFARELAARAVHVAAACRRALSAATTPVLATPAWPLTAAGESVPKSSHQYNYSKLLN